MPVLDPVLRKDREMTQLTDEDLLQWLGSDVSVADLIDMLRDLANGVYRIEQMRQDIDDTLFS
jgi:putative SOS response-associated peptidase YedK